ncbi:MAG: flagellar biosynthesis protein FlhF [Nitrospiraceae bacterium]|nr:MAG: flagellar biosynthesis protein FlhF [Nitrospiraceae bacterium]
MKIKKYQAKSFSAALRAVKRELGQDAMILSTEDRKNGSSFVEVTAAVDYDFAEPRVMPADSRNQVPPGNSELSELKMEIQELKNSIENMKSSGCEISLPLDRKKMYLFLKERSIREDLAIGLAERASSVEDIEHLLSGDIEMGGSGVGEVGDRRIIMLIGPTGVGKTTTTAKLASNAIGNGKKVGIISLDTYKIGAAEQIRIYARMMGVPLDIVSNREGLNKSIQRFSDKDLILIDTTGQNPKNEDYIHRLRGLYELGHSIETHLLFSTSGDCDFFIESCKHYENLPVDCMAFTKTDEAVKLGSIYNLCHYYQKPVAYITNGQRVPGNIEFVNSRKLTNLILTTGSA